MLCEVTILLLLKRHDYSAAITQLRAAPASCGGTTIVNKLYGQVTQVMFGAENVVYALTKSCSNQIGLQKNPEILNHQWKPMTP